MVSKTLRGVARLAWFAPVLLLFLTINQVKVAFDLRATWLHGTRATAYVKAHEDSDRADVTYGYVSLEVPLPDGQTLTKERMSLPKTFLPRLKGQEAIEVRVRVGAAQEVVIASLMPAHWVLAASQAGMAFVGMLLFGAGVLWWNRSLFGYESMRV